MIVLSNDKSTRWQDLVLLLYAISIPWPIGINNISIALLILWWIGQGQFALKWNLLRQTRWVWAFIFFYVTLIVLTIQTSSFEVTSSEALQKITILILPIILATGGPLSARVTGQIKRGFIYSCFVIVLMSLIVALVHFYTNDPIQNFDAGADASYNLLHPMVTTAWMHFSYIQLLKWIDLHPTYFSMYLVFCLAILLNEQFANKGTKFFHQAMAVVISAFIILLSSRMAIIVLGLCLMTAIVKNASERKSESAFQAAGLMAVIVLVLWASPVSKFRMIEEPSLTEYRLNHETTAWNSVNYRLLEWKASLTVIWKNPLLGIGPEAAQEAMNEFYRHFSNSTVNVNYNAHNQYLQTLMEYGVIGLIGLLACIFIPLLHRNIEVTHIAFILIFSIICLTESLLERQKGIVFFTFFQSILLCSQKKAA